jgi:hypothetical protein
VAVLLALLVVTTSVVVVVVVDAAQLTIAGNDSSIEFDTASITLDAATRSLKVDANDVLINGFGVVASLCADGIKNGAELGVDCGGWCDAACEHLTNAGQVGGVGALRTPFMNHSTSGLPIKMVTMRALLGTTQVGTGYMFDFRTENADPAGYFIYAGSSSNNLNFFAVDGVSVSVTASSLPVEQEFGFALQLATAYAREVHVGMRFSEAESISWHCADLAFWTRTLSAPELTQLAADPFDYAGFAGDLIAHYPLAGTYADVTGQKATLPEIVLASKLSFGKGWAPLG